MVDKVKCVSIVELFDVYVNFEQACWFQDVICSGAMLLFI